LEIIPEVIVQIHWK